MSRMDRLFTIDVLRRTGVCLLIASIFGLPSVYGAFKDIGFAARPAGMGGAFVAVCNDVNAAIYNPAGLATISKKELAFAYTKPYMGLENVDLSMMYLSYIHPLKFGNMGAAITSFNGGGLYTESMFQASYARRVVIDEQDVYYAGINVKYLSHTYNWDERTLAAAEQLNDPVVKAGNTKSAPSADLGLLAVYNKRLSVGVAARYINTPDLGLKYEDLVPMDVRGGAAYRIPYWKGMDAITFAVDVSQRMQEWGKEADKTNIHAGAEAWFAVHKYALRMGGNMNEMTFGMALNHRFGQNLTLQIDYALMWSLKISDNTGTHRLGASVKF